MLHPNYWCKPDSSSVIVFESLMAGNVYYEVNFRLSSVLETSLPNTIHHTVLYETVKGSQKYET